MNWIQKVIAFFGRALLSIIFISSGIYSVVDWSATQQNFSAQLMSWIAITPANSNLYSAIEFGIANAFILLIVGVIFEIVGGLMVFFGLFARFGAFLLILFLIPVTLVHHHFWQLPEPESGIQMVHFLKNVSICGGLLLVMALVKGRKWSKEKEKPVKKK